MLERIPALRAAGPEIPYAQQLVQRWRRRRSPGCRPRLTGLQDTIDNILASGLSWFRVGGKRSQVEGRDRWTVSVLDKQSQVEVSGLRWRGLVSGGGERSLAGDLRWSLASLVEGSDRWWRGAVSGGGQQFKVDGSDRWWSGLRWRGGIAGGGERSLVEWRDRWWRGAIAGGVERSQVEGSDRW